MIRQHLFDYCDQVLSGEVIACQKHKWACERFLSDLEREGTEDFPYLFDGSKAVRFLKWMALFKHRKGVLAGEFIKPHIIQAFVFGNIYGWVHMETGYRRFRRFYWQVARKNAKTQSLAIMALYEASAFREPAAEVLCAATKREKAKLCWDEAKALSTQPGSLKGKFHTAYNIINHIASESTIKTLSKDDKRDGDGDNPSCGIVDEYHAHDTTEMYDMLKNGMVARKQPILGTITTAGFDLNKPCHSIEYQYIGQVLDPDNPVFNEQYFVMVNELDEGDEITDESNWPKANPIVCSYPAGVENLRDDLKVALDVPEKMRDYLTKNMNVWVDMKPQGYMEMKKWRACGIKARGEKMPDVSGQEVIVGVDLSSKIDLTSVTLELLLNRIEYPIDMSHLDDIREGESNAIDGPWMWHGTEEVHKKLYVIFSHSFMPEDTLTAKRQTDRVDYDLWRKQGWITMTPGGVVDFNFVSKWIIDCAKTLEVRIREICFDPYNATQMANDLTADGYECVEVRQGVMTLSEPTKSFREQVILGNVVHDDNPVLGWAIANAVTRTDQNENIMLDKSKSSDRIDPIAATINAHVRGILLEDTSCYDDRPEGEKLFTV